MSDARPMTPTRRAIHYCEREDSTLTPAQMRRFRKKFNRYTKTDYRDDSYGIGPEKYAVETGPHRRSCCRPTGNVIGALYRDA